MCTSLTHLSSLLLYLSLSLLIISSVYRLYKWEIQRINLVRNMIKVSTKKPGPNSSEGSSIELPAKDNDVNFIKRMMNRKISPGNQVPSKLFFND